MVNWLHLYSAFIQSALQFYASHSPIHTHIQTPTAIGCHARYQPAHQEQLGVRRLAQGHFDTPTVGSNRQPSNCQTTALTSWAISPHLFYILYLQNTIRFVSENTENCTIIVAHLVLLKIIISWGIFFLWINLLQLKVGCFSFLQHEIKLLHQMFNFLFTHLYQGCQ